MNSLTKLQKSVINKAATTLANQLSVKIALETKFLLEKQMPVAFNFNISWNEANAVFDVVPLPVDDPFI